MHHVLSCIYKDLASVAKEYQARNPDITTTEFSDAFDIQPKPFDIKGFVKFSLMV